MQHSSCIQNGWFQRATHLPSANCDARPAEAEISLLIIHNISLPPGQFGSGCVESFFLNQLDCDLHPYFDQLRDVCVSAHCLIARDGAVTQFVPFEQRAWHAGQSCFQGRTRCNDFSIGIELEGTDDVLYTDTQYDSLANLTRALMLVYPAITPERIKGHSDIAPGRKTDPGPSFDWSKFLHSL